MQHRGPLGYLQATSQGTDCGRLLLIPLLRTPTEPTLSYHILCSSRAITHTPGGRTTARHTFPGLRSTCQCRTLNPRLLGGKGSDASDHQYRGMPILPAFLRGPPPSHGMWLPHTMEGRLMDSLFEQGYHGRATALTLESTARVTGRSSLLSLQLQLDDISGEIAPAGQPAFCKIPARAANCILAEEGPRALLPSVTASLRHCVTALQK